MSSKSCVGNILNGLKRKDLISLCELRWLNRIGKKAVLHHRLRSSFRSKPIELLSFLTKNQLRDVAKQFEVNISGNKETLIQNIIASDSYIMKSNNTSSGSDEWEIDLIEEYDEDEDEDGLELPNRYEKMGSIGSGGFGEAYLCKDTKLDRKVVIKKPHETNKESILEEARLQAKFDNSNIVHIYDIDDGSSSIVMEYCSGGDLRGRLEDGSLNEYEVKQLIIGVCKGLKDIHEKEVIHKDIGPHNIFYDGEGNIKIGDFGISQSNTASHYSKGYHPLYHAPDDFINHGGSYDMYTLGQTILSCLTGISDEVIDRSHLPDKFKVSDKILWVIAWLLLAENPEKVISAEDVLLLIMDN